MAVNGAGCKRKGAAFEHALSTWLRTYVGCDAARSRFCRDPLMASGEGAADLIGVPGLSVEAKRVERLAFPAALRQAVRNAADDEMPVVVNRRNRQAMEDATVVLRLADFARLYRAWAASEGFL